MVKDISTMLEGFTNLYRFCHQTANEIHEAQVFVAVCN